MSEELIDFRGRITPETDCALEAEHRITGRDRAEIAREWLHKMALDRIHAAKVLDRLLRNKGVGAAHEGAGGIDEGIGGKLR